MRLAPWVIDSSSPTKQQPILSCVDKGRSDAGTVRESLSANRLGGSCHFIPKSNLSLSSDLLNADEISEQEIRAILSELKETFSETPH